ncbi:Hypothetical protein I595_222 [Croceitalea dokdonensis DOKDO 023]|uniref:DUF4258 domain-containing protein n=1 Tax=Croceitalea dokdonensis DOKDO 023 TaxID=1300341 RepID=A0A0P7B221_9FLAO|nr:hypothetical protein [Croceitalea dokdonensis]KPM33319.1 Hypothetical protein I595_222 [Croceitalea dokdonensis DOKDO 023]
MAFIKRLGWYLVGLSIGIIFLSIFLKKKSEETGTEFCYFPNCRVLKDIRSKSFSIEGAPDTLYTYEQLDSLTKDILKNGEIDFKSSDTKTAPCKTYLIFSDGKERSIRIKNCPEKAFLERL